ncbi:HNH endonuclease [Arthrobacter phage KBurrousTX]|uniref:HNH endonuclease n=1 Tax=Arthrobacter phage KBurrousTX TaxID=2315608 RepID=A0A386KBI0_9CAUD|nr:HNH endonuclease [Arthrobacter phage KBurrousTX]AYD81590.1 HNH endonuclease [Arthrobacter phage KBurrousTX]
MPKPGPVERFWAKVDQREDHECWPWRAGIAKETGYGIFHPATDVTKLAHRFAYELANGPIPAGLVLDHTCHNEAVCIGKCVHRACVNPAHTVPRTRQDNTNLAPFANIKKTHCPRGHEYTPENTYRAPSRPKSRRCKRCWKYHGRTAQQKEAA